MKINGLMLQNYRNHESFKEKFESNGIIIIGSNGAGKTNILESINLLSTGKSPRARYDRDLIKYDEKFCTIGGIIERSDETLEMQLQIIKEDESSNRSKKNFKVNKVSKSYTKFIGRFNSVLFTPENIRLLTGSPSRRRNYLDDVIRQVDPQYKKSSIDYVKALRRRNKILEKIGDTSAGKDYLDYWTNKVLEEGQYIQEKREGLIKYFQKPFSKYSKELNKEETEVEITYKPNIISKERFEKYKNKEIEARTTLIGPHRDEFIVNFNGYNISEFGSRGQQRSTLLALKTCEIDYIEYNNKERPVLLLDDIFSELDVKHQEAVLEIIPKQQTFITSTELPHFIKDFQEIFL